MAVAVMCVAHGKNTNTWWLVDSHYRERQSNVVVRHYCVDVLVAQLKSLEITYTTLLVYSFSKSGKWAWPMSGQKKFNAQICATPIFRGPVTLQYIRTWHEVEYPN